MNKYSEARIKFLRNREALLSGRVDDIQIKLYDVLAKDMLGKLVVEDGNIISTPVNYELLKKLDAIYNFATSADNKAALKQLADDLVKIGDLNTQYFTEIAGATPVVKLTSRAVGGIINQKLGVNADGKILKGGFLDKFTKDKTVSSDIRKTMMKAISGKKDFIQLRNELKEKIVGNPEKKKIGKLQQYYRNNAYDLYQEIDRTAGNKFADSLDLNHFMYSGGIIAHSRKFCRVHNGHVYSRADAEHWVNMIGDDYGPIYDKDTYDPFINLGGWGCRHSIDWVTDSFAARRKAL